MYAIKSKTAPPSLLVVCHCGEWKIGQVLDCYVLAFW